MGKFVQQVGTTYVTLHCLNRLKSYTSENLQPISIIPPRATLEKAARKNFPINHSNEGGKQIISSVPSLFWLAAYDLFRKYSFTSLKVCSSSSSRHAEEKRVLSHSTPGPRRRI